MMTQEMDESWQVWYQDNFDRETPRRVEAAGEGLEYGIFELWRRHFSETILANGGRGFACFNLWWAEAGCSVEVVGDWEAQGQLRKWLLDHGWKEEESFGKELDGDLLRMIASRHAALVRRGETSERLLEKVLEVESKAEFINWLEEMG